MSGDRAVLVDGATVALVGTAACAWGMDLPRMTVVVAAAYVLRVGAWALVPRDERPLPWSLELPFLLACALLGGLNDWNTVVRHGVYSYGVPTDLGELSSIPGWMLAYWGLILRFVATLGAWPRLGPPGESRGGAAVSGRAARVGVLLALVLVTRQCIYRLWGDPWLSWLPFAVALGAHAWLLPWGPRERRLALVAAVVGPLAEAALIGVGGVHRYALGWLLGVPLWIALWWVLATLVWAELARAAFALSREGASTARAGEGPDPDRRTEARA